MNIALDLGHADGTDAQANGTGERALSLPVMRHVSRLLEAAGHTVQTIDFPEMSNTDDLNATVKAANLQQLDLGLSFHCNSGQAGARGAMVLYYSDKTKDLAERFAKPLAAMLPGRADIIQKRPKLQVLRGTKAPWLLLELGFVTNTSDVALLRTQPEKVAREIVKVINSM